MRHSNSGRKLSRTPAHRKALLQNLAKALLQHGRIRTTEMKAMELRRVVEPLITLAKRNDLHARRQAYSVLNDHALVKRLFDVIGPVFAAVPGGYTRVIKFALPRKGDNAPMAIIELSRPVEGLVAGTSVKAEQKSAKPAKIAETESSHKAENAAVDAAEKADEKPEKAGKAERTFTVKVAKAEKPAGSAQVESDVAPVVKKPRKSVRTETKVAETETPES